MGLYKRNEVWYYTIYVNHRRIRKSTDTGNKRLAQDIYAKARVEVREGKYFQKDQGNKKMFKDMADKYMAEYAREKAAGSVERDETSLKHLLPVFGVSYLSQITPTMINRYKTQRINEGASPKSINHELGFCKHAFNLAIQEWEWIKDNPFVRVRPEKLPLPRVRYLTGEEFERVYQACTNRLKPIVKMAVYSGMRQDNVLSLKWQDVDLKRGVIVLQHTKNGERLGLPMNEPVKNLLIELNKVRHINCDYVFHDATGNRFSRRAIGLSFKRTCQKVGIQDFRFHDLRHTAASWMVQNGVDLYIVQRILGHKTAAMTQRYAHLAPDNLKAGMNSLNGIGTATKTATAVDIGSTGNG